MWSNTSRTGALAGNQRPGDGHPAAAAAASERRWGQRWSYELVPDGSDATIVTEIYDCSLVPADTRRNMDDGEVWAEGMARTLELLDAACTRTDAADPKPLHYRLDPE
jgi:hypothetical protein